MNNEVQKRKLGTRNGSLFPTLEAVACNVKLHTDEQHAIVAHELQSELMLAMGLSNIYCEL